MKKFMVIDCCEREIGEPEFFDTMEKAQIHLFELFIEACRHIDVDNYNFCNISTMDELEEAIESLVDVIFLMMKTTSMIHLHGLRLTITITGMVKSSKLTSNRFLT